LCLPRGGASAAKLNEADLDACRTVTAQIGKDGNISILENNAGINRHDHITGDPAAVTKDWDDIIAINPDGVFNVTHAFLPTVTRQQRADSESRFDAVVCSRARLAEFDFETRHARLRRALAAELGRDGIRSRHRSWADRDEDQR
jgi:NAD(P)-dependent dehydrogenase (short-subunit alcohol dehydrogenase family)